MIGRGWVYVEVHGCRFGCTGEGAFLYVGSSGGSSLKGISWD